MIYVLLATAGMAGFAVYLFRRHINQQIAAARADVHGEYMELVNGLDLDGNKLKAAILAKYDAAVARLRAAV